MTDRKYGLAALLATGLAALAPAAMAGGPLAVVPTAQGLQPARWEGTVRVFTDLGTLGVVDNTLANELVGESLKEWTSVPTSSFKARVVGTTGDLGLGDIVGSNAGSVIGTDNGGGLHVIYDADGTVLTDFFGAGFGVLGIATPEFLAAEGSTQIVEGWAVITAQGEGVEEVVSGDPLSGVITHELGHAIGLAHTQTNGYYFRNQPIEVWGVPAGPEHAGPDQCDPTVTDYPTAEQVETMYPFIDPYPTSPTYNSPGMATVNVADDRSALSWLYPSPTYRQGTGTLIGRVTANDRITPLTGINVIARNVADPFDAISRISGDETQGMTGPDGSFEITGLKPGARYVIYIDEIGPGGFSTPKAILLGPEEYWNISESADASRDDACAATEVTASAGTTRRVDITVNGIAGSPAFVQLPYSLPNDVSDNGGRIVGTYGPFQSPFWTWTAQNDMQNIRGTGFLAAVSGDGRVIGGTVPKLKETEFGPIREERAALWTRAGGWKSIAAGRFQGCDIFHSTVFDVNGDGTAAVGLVWPNCTDASAFRWTAAGGMRKLSKTSTGASRANAVSGDGELVGGWEEVPEAQGLRAGSLWQGNEQMLLTDPEAELSGGYVSEVMAINNAGTIAVGYGAGAANKDAYQWTTEDGLVNIGRYPEQVCWMDYNEFGELVEFCDDRAAVPTSVSNDGKVVTGQSQLLYRGVNDATIYTPALGWMLVGDFLASQGVLEMSRWQVLGSRISANGKVLIGTAFPLAGDYWQGFRLDLRKVFVCHAEGGGATMSVGFPGVMDEHLLHGDTLGLCPQDAPL